MNKLVSRNPILRFKLGNRIEKFLTPSRGITISKSEVSRFGPTATRILQGWKNSLFPDILENNNTIYMSTPSPRRQNTQNSNSTQVSTGANVSKTARNGLRAVEMNTSLELAQKANLEKMMAEETSRKKANSVRKPAVRKPAAVTKPTVVTKPAIVANRAAAGYTLPEGITDVAAILRLLKDYYNLDYVNSGVKIDDGIWGKETQAAWEAYKNKLAADVGGTTGTTGNTSNVTSTPTNTGTTVSGNGYSFTLPTNINTNTNANTNIYESYYPGTHNAPIFYNGRSIRKEGRGNYTNRSEYWDWLLNNKNSNLYKLWSNVFGNDGYLNEEIYNNMMSLYGIDDEDFNRKSSKKLATLLNDLNLIGVQGHDKDGNIVMSDARRAFLTNFDRNLPSSEEINEYVRTNTPVRTNTSARPNLSTINWGLYPNIISGDNLFTNINKSEYPNMFPIRTRISDIFNNNTLFNPTPHYRLYKNGGLISRNPINRFKSIAKGKNGLKTKKYVLKGKDDLGNNVVKTTIEKQSSNFFKTPEMISQEVTYNTYPESNDTVYNYYPEHWIFLPLKIEHSNNWATPGVSLRRPLFEKLRTIFNNLNGTPKFRNFIKVAQ